MSTLAGKPIGRNGLGLMRMTIPPVTPDEEAFQALRAALDAGVNVWDGADFYGSSEASSLHLMNRYFTKYPEDADRVVLCIKTGMADFGSMTLDCSPAKLREFADKAIGVLDGKKDIDIFGPCRTDPKVPIEDSVRALAELKREGKIKGIQLSEVGASTIRRAAAVVQIDMVEAEISLWSTDVFENGVAQVCAENSIIMFAHTPLGYGFLTGQFKTLEDLPKDDFARQQPRFQPDAFRQNLRLVEAVEKLAKKKGCSCATLALNWIKAQSRKPGMPQFVPIPGGRTPARVEENAREVELHDGELEELDLILKSCPVTGGRTVAAIAKLNEY